jgi:dipeptidyl aminopeptidase/acylaminoacyl peptidase
MTGTDDTRLSGRPGNSRTRYLVGLAILALVVWLPWQFWYSVLAAGPELPQELQFIAEYDKSVQKYMILRPKGFDPNGEHDVLIAFHGHGSDRRQYVTADRGEAKGARDVAAKHNMIVVSPDYRAPAGWMGIAAEADTVQLISELKRQFKVRKVYLTGGSMGGAAVLTFTTLHPDLVDGVSSQNGVANLLEYSVDLDFVVRIQTAIKDAFGGGKDETPEQYKKRNPEEYRKRSAEFHPEKFTMPLAITVGGKDTLVPPQSVLRLAEAVKKHNANVLVINRPNGGHETNYADSVAALEFVIATAEKRTAE